jgi:hypothetical protein
VDIGAFESQGFTLTVSSGSNQHTPVYTAFAGPLVLQVAANNAVEPVNGGRVTFLAPGSGASAVLNSNPASIGSDQASVTATANGTAGTYTVSAMAAGAGSGVTFSLTNDKAVTMIVIGSSANPAVYGQAVTFTATVTANGAPATALTGTVQFVVDGQNYGAPVALSNGTAISASIASLVVTAAGSSHTITAIYSGDGNFLGSTGALSQVVNRASTAVAVASSANTSLLNQPVTFTATVSPMAPGAGLPSGTVQFQMDGINIGAPVTLVNGQASLITAAVPVGSHSIAVVYSGDGNFLGSSGQVGQAVYYHFGGFLAPLTAYGSYHVGSTLYLKWQLTDYYGNYISSLSAVTSLQVQSVDAQGHPLAAPFNPTSAGGSGLQYDPSANQYVFHWKTKGLTAGYYEIELTLADGTLETLVVQLR